MVHPSKIFSGPLYKTHSELDFWPKEWIEHITNIDISDVTFIIPVSYDHQDRKDNLKIILKFLSKFSTNIIIGEQGGEYFKSFSNTTHSIKYIKFTYKEFHRTKMLNRMNRNCNQLGRGCYC